MTIGKEFCEILRGVGVDSHVQEPDDPTIEPDPTIEIRNGLISRVTIHMPYDCEYCDGYGAEWLVPDSRLERSRLNIIVRSIRLKSIPLVGPVGHVRWRPGAIEEDGVYHWSPEFGDHSSSVAEHLGQNMRVKEHLMSDGGDVGVSADLDEGAWALSPKDHMSYEKLMAGITASRTALYVAKAETLLAMPLPRDD